MRLYLVQHGEAVAEDVDRARPLSAITKVARFLAASGLSVSQVLHSGKLRGCQGDCGFHGQARSLGVPDGAALVYSEETRTESRPHWPTGRPSVRVDSMPAYGPGLGFPGGSAGCRT
jgi:hypothetical protein